MKGKKKTKFSPLKAMSLLTVMFSFLCSLNDRQAEGNNPLFIGFNILAKLFLSGR